MSGVPGWVEAVTAALIVASGIAAVVASLGFVRLASFFARMHPPALASTFGVWAVVLASIVYYSALEGVPVLHAWVIPILLAIAPIVGAWAALEIVPVNVYAPILA